MIQDLGEAVELEEIEKATGQCCEVAFKYEELAKDLDRRDGTIAQDVHPLEIDETTLDHLGALTAVALEEGGHHRAMIGFRVRLAESEEEVLTDLRVRPMRDQDRDREHRLVAVLHPLAAIDLVQRLRVIEAVIVQGRAMLARDLEVLMGVAIGVL